MRSGFHESCNHLKTSNNQNQSSPERVLFLPCGHHRFEGQWLEHVFHSKLHDPGVVGLRDLTKGPAIERSKRIIRISGGGDQRPHTVGDFECFPTSFQALVLSDPENSAQRRI
jgi:hypothetical protein